ncbi:MULTISPECIES: hypothetical protein [unclassified Bacillus (in: firmicutes)]|uniref:hypothetical protein n=1 Tax=unclassified Bacillus (in: firmicutes) TaxID=185979 RepID=UPI000471DDA6|nr:MULTISPECIES: hypothetical protein [unclassified Bacillus (in: firmicutes)]PGZ94823.1 hypothetical protein COE53_01300 [Bacillus sp. AFS029533]SFC76587.1 hypothetical protein SAMN02799633_01624 [Bacillus sp. UNCCL81]
MVKIRDVLKYFGVITMLFFAAYLIIKYIREDEIFSNLIFGFCVGLLLFLGYLLSSKNEREK